MESQLMFQFLNLDGATAEERALLRRLQSLALAGHCKVTLPADREPGTPPPPPAAAAARLSPAPPAAEEAAEEAGRQPPQSPAPPAAADDEKLVQETCRQPPDGIEFAADETPSAAAVTSAPPPPPLLAQNQGLLGDMPPMGPGGLLTPALQHMPMPAMLHGAGQPHQMYHHHHHHQHAAAAAAAAPPQHCPPGYPPLYNLMYPPAGYLPAPAAYSHHEQPPVEPEPRPARRGAGHKHNGKPEKMYGGGAGGGYTMTSRAAAGPPLVMAPYPGHPAQYHPHMFQMAYHHPYHAYPYPGAVPPEMMMHPMQAPAQQQMDVAGMPPQPHPAPGPPQPVLSPPPAAVVAPEPTPPQPLLPTPQPPPPRPPACDELAGRPPLGVAVVTPVPAVAQPDAVETAAPAGTIAAPVLAAVPAVAGPVRLSFGFDLDDKLTSDGGRNSAVQLDTISPVPPAACSSPAASPVCATEADGRLQEGRPDVAAASTDTEPTEPGGTASRLLGAPIPASYVATVTVSARVIDCEELKQRCASPADSQDSGVAHTDMEVCSPVNNESTAPEVVTVAGKANSEDVEVSSSPVIAADLTPIERTTNMETPAVAVPSEVPTAAAAPAATDLKESSKPEPPLPSTPAAVDKLAEPATTPAPAPAAAAAPAPAWGGTRSWASLFSKKPEPGGPAPPPTPAPKQPAPPPPPVADSELLSLGAALAKFEPNYKSVSLQPRGLTNKSNWCYVNSVLQALASCPPFYHLMKALPSNIGLQRGQSRTPIIDAMVEFMSELRPLPEVPRVTRRERERGHLRDLSLGAPFEPGYVYQMLSKVSGDAFKVDGRQEDAEEFLTCLLSGLQDEMADVLKVYEKNQQGEKTVNGSTNGREDSASDDDCDDWQTVMVKNRGQVTRSAELQTTPISRIFSGQLRSALHRQGSKATATVQSFFSLQLDIQSSSVTSVDEALEQLVNRDAVHGLTCPTTGRPVEAWQQAALELVPPTLILHLKRFLFDPDGVQKLMKRVTYNVDLELKRDLLSAARGKLGPGQKRYRLFAVIYHSGKESTKGHYITDAYHPAYQQWVRYDDSTVTAVPEATVLRPESPLMPYILFYRRLEPHGPPAAAAGPHPHPAHNGK